MASALEVIVNILHTVPNASWNEGQFFIKFGDALFQRIAFVVVEQTNTDYRCDFENDADFRTWRTLLDVEEG